MCNFGYFRLHLLEGNVYILTHFGNIFEYSLWSFLDVLFALLIACILSVVSYSHLMVVRKRSMSRFAWCHLLLQPLSIHCGCILWLFSTEIVDYLFRCSARGWMCERMQASVIRERASVSDRVWDNAWVAQECECECKCECDRVYVCMCDCMYIFECACTCKCKVYVFAHPTTSTLSLCPAITHQHTPRIDMQKKYRIIHVDVSVCMCRGVCTII